MSFMTIVKEIQIIFFNGQEHKRYEVVDMHDIEYLLPKHQTVVKGYKTYEIQKHNDKCNIINYYVDEIEALITSGNVSDSYRNVTFLAHINCDSSKAEVELLDIDQVLCRLWLEDKLVDSGLNGYSLFLFKEVLNQLKFTRGVLQGSRLNLKCMLEKYVEKGRRGEIMKMVCVNESLKDSKDIRCELVKEILRLEVEELMSSLNVSKNLTVSLLIEYERLVDKKLEHTEERNIYNFYNPRGEIGDRTYNKIKRNSEIYNPSLLRNYLRQSEEKLREIEHHRFLILDELCSTRLQLDQEKMKNQRILNDQNLEMVYTRKINSNGEKIFEEAIDRGAELLTDISSISNQLLELGFKFHKFSPLKASKNSYFIDCLTAGRDFIEKLSSHLIIMLETRAKLESELVRLDNEWSNAVVKAGNLKQENFKLQQQIDDERLLIEDKSLERDRFLGNADKMSQFIKNNDHRFGKKEVNYDSNFKLLSTENRCILLEQDLQAANIEREELSSVIREQDETLETNRKVIEELKVENEFLKSKNDDLTGNLIAAMLLLYHSKTLVKNWINENGKGEEE